MSVDDGSANEEHSAPGGRSAPPRGHTVPPAGVDAPAVPSARLSAAQRRSARLSAAGRKEAAIDPAGGPVNRFAIKLRDLRAAVGNPSYRVMGEATNYAPNTLSRAAGPGTKVPSWPVVAAYVRFCGGDLQEWALRYDALVEETGEKRPRVFAPHPEHPGKSRVRDTVIYRDASRSRSDRATSPSRLVILGALIAIILGAISAPVNDLFSRLAGPSGCSYFNQDVCDGSYLRTYSAGAGGLIEVRSAASYESTLRGTVPSGALVYASCVSAAPPVLETDVVRAQEMVDELQAELVAELNGTGGSTSPGQGEIYEAKRALLDDLLRRLDAAEFALKQATWFRIESAPDDEVDTDVGWVNSQYLEQPSDERPVPICDNS